MNTRRTIYGRFGLLLVAGLVLAVLAPIGATLARSGPGYHLTTVAAPEGALVGSSPKAGTSSGGSYVLTQIETTISSARSRAGTYALAPLTTGLTQANICVHLPIVMRNR